MILNLTFDEIDLITRAVKHATDENSNIFWSEEAEIVLLGLEHRLEALASMTDEAVATAWEAPIKNDKGNTKHWLRMVEVRVFSEMTYVFRVRAEDLVKNSVDPIHEHSVVVGNLEYRTTQPAPAEIHRKALEAFVGVSAWMADAGVTGENVKKVWNS